jgi:hypothetical protein
VNAARSEQVGVLLDERELWFLQDANQVAFRERFQGGRDRNSSNEPGTQILESGQFTARSFVLSESGVGYPQNSLGDQTKLDEVLRFDLLEQRTQILRWRVHLPCAADGRCAACRLRNRGKKGSRARGARGGFRSGSCWCGRDPTRKADRAFR